MLGLGNALARAYVSRPNCTVVGSIRDDTAPSVAELKAFPKGSGSRLVLVKIENAQFADALNAVKQMENQGIDHIDILIPNAGVSPPLTPIEVVDPAVVANAFHVNALGPLALYQACHGLLKKSSNPRFTPISSAAATISGMERYAINASYSLSLPMALFPPDAWVPNCHSWLTFDAN